MEIEGGIFERFLHFLLRPEEIEDIMGVVDEKGGKVTLRQALDLLEPYPFTRSFFRKAYASRVLWTEKTSDLRAWLNAELSN